MFRLSNGDKNMFILIQYQCDGWMDGRTDGRTDRHLCSSNTSTCIACYAIALQKMATVSMDNSNLLMSLLLAAAVSTDGHFTLW